MFYRGYCGDCLREMGAVATSSVDLILTDLPYGVTKDKFDVPLDFGKMWAEYKRVLR